MDDETTKSMITIFRFNVLAFFAGFTPWIGAVSGQLAHRGLVSSVFGEVLIVSGLMFLGLILIFLALIYFNPKNPLRQIVPILFTMSFTSILSAFLAVCTYFFL